MVTTRRGALLAAFLFTSSLSLSCVHAQAGVSADLSAPTMQEILEAATIDSLSVDPTNLHIAFRVVSTSTARNEVRAQWYVADLTGKSSPEKVGTQNEPIFMPFFDLVEDGIAAWGPASSLLVIEPGQDGIQIHRLSRDGGDVSITNDAADIVDFAASNGGIDYRVRNARAVIANLQESERIGGIHFDRTVYPDGIRLTDSFEVAGRSTSLRRRDASYAGEAFEGALQVKHLNIPGLPSAASGSARTLELKPGTKTDLTLSASRSGLILKLVPDPDQAAEAPIKRFIVTAETSQSRQVFCKHWFCRGVTGALKQLMLSPDGSKAIVLFEKDESGRTGVYEWDPRTDRTRTILPAETYLSGGSSYTGSGCAYARANLICVEASATAPPRLIALDLATGRKSELFDPNKMLRHKHFLSSVFLEWTDSHGRAVNGILTMPEHTTGLAPLVITSYRCKGFLRGGTANLAPEQSLAQKGIAALCVNLNTDSVVASTLSREPAQTHPDTVDGYAAAIDMLAARNLIDRNRVGIAGHSYSSMTAAYAVSHSKLFAAAVIGTGITTDPFSYVLTAPSADSWRKSVLTSLNLPLPQRDPDHVWSEISPALNAEKITAPLLIQSPENEWLMALQLYTYMQDAGGTVDMFVYPGSGHMLGRIPSHQYWRAKRSIEWFKFWLLGAEAPATGSSEVDMHWQKLRNTARAPNG